MMFLSILNLVSALAYPALITWLTQIDHNPTVHANYHACQVMLSDILLSPLLWIIQCLAHQE